jgi:hypothetical protein
MPKTLAAYSVPRGISLQYVAAIVFSTVPAVFVAATRSSGTEGIELAVGLVAVPLSWVGWLFVTEPVELNLTDTKELVISTRARTLSWAVEDVTQVEIRPLNGWTLAKSRPRDMAIFTSRSGRKVKIGVADRPSLEALLQQLTRMNSYVRLLMRS